MTFIALGGPAGPMTSPVKMTRGGGWLRLESLLDGETRFLRVGLNHDQTSTIR
jgi:hypothetical protein